ncbi:tail fiber domain-containing protein [bacterium]|nr:tail fiber domain-containing protein [bacterium]
MQGAGVSKYGDDVATWDFDGAGAVTEAGMTNFTVTPSGTLTMQGGGASKYGDDTATLDFDGAGAVSETGMTTIALTPSSTVDIDAGGALTIDSASTIGIGTDAVAQSINVGTGAAARTITIGNTTGATAVNVNLGTGGMAITQVGDSGVGPFPQVKMHNNSASPAANDFLAGIYFDGDDSAGNQTTYARVQARIKDPTSTTEDGALAFYTMIDGTETLTMDLGMSGNLMATFRGSLVPSDANTYSLGITDLEWSDLYLGDGAVLGFGNDQDVTLTHVADTGLLLNSTRELQFRDSALKIWSSADGQLDVSADTEVQIATAAFDVNATGAVTIDGATMSVKGTGASVYGDDVATWDFDGAGAVTETGMTNLTVTPSGTLTMQGAGVSKYGDDVATWDFDGAGAVTEAGMTNFTVTPSGTLTMQGAGVSKYGDDVATLDFDGAGALSETGMTTIAITPSSTVDIDAGGALTIDSASTIGIGTDAVAQNINVGTGAAARTITIGNTTGSTAVNVNLGTGGMAITQVGDSGSGPYPQVKMHNNSSSPAANDFLAGIYFDGEDSASNQTTYARVQARIKDPTSTTEDGALAFYTMIAGTETLTMDLGMSGNLMATFRGSLVPSDANTYSLGITDLEWSDLYLGDGAVLGFGNDQDVTLTHVADTGLLLNSSRELQFRDSALKISSSADGQLDIDADTEIEITAPTVDINASSEVNVSGAMKVGGALTPNSADGSALGSAALEWSDLFLADGAAISLGNTQDATITHDTATDGLDFKRVATSANTPMILTLQTGSTAVVASDVIGAIDFQAPDEAGGTDSILIAAGIEAVSEGTFGAANNATKLSFKTAASEAAAEKMRLSSTGVLTLNGGSGSIIIPNSGTIGSVGTTDAITIASDGVVALKITDGGTIGSATTPAAITIASDGVVTFVDDVLIKNAGTIGSAGDPDAISISSGGVVAVTATTASSSSTTGALTVGGGLGVAADLWVGDDVSLASDSAVLSFGATSDATITHDSATDGLDFKRVATAANTPMILTLQTGSTAVVVSDVIGAIDFQAPDEAGGTDAILIAAGIEAVSEGTFGIANNATKLSFKTAASEAAAEKMSLSSTGVLTVKGSVVPSVADAAALGSATLEWSDLFLADGSVINLGNDQDVKLTHIADTGVRLNDAMALQFRDSAISIASSADGQLDIDADTKLDVVAPTVDFTSTVAVLATTPSVIIDSATASKPLFELKNTTNDTAAAKFRFVMDKGAAGAAGDLSGTIEFYADDTLQNNQEFARVEAKVKTATSGAEDGSLIFYTARTDGTLTKMMDIGDTAVDTITVRSDVLPSGDNLYKSGSSSAGWSAVYSSTGFFESSDRCLKRDIMMSDLGLDFINDLNPVSYRRISGKNPKASYGLIAQELEEVVTRHGHPDFAGIHRPGGESEKYGVAYSSLIAPLIRSVQELSSRSEDTQVMYEDMQTRYEAVQAQYESMQAQIDDLRKKLKKDKKDK